MKKILLSLTILAVGATAFHRERQTSNQLQDEAVTLRRSLMLETQRVAAVQTEKAGLTERVGELKQTLALVKRPAFDNELWSALQTNRADRLPRKLRERLHEELGFNWNSFKDYIVVSKKTVRSLEIKFLQPDGQLNDAAFAAVAITPEERARLEAGIEKAKADFKDWVRAHLERVEPADDVVVNYSLRGDTTTARDIRANFFAAVAGAVGEERSELIKKTAVAWMYELGMNDRFTRLTIKREKVGDESRFKAELQDSSGNNSGYLPMKDRDFPKALRLLFPNRWADLAEREGFELPKESPRK